MIDNYLRNTKISVAMATYNGEKYLKEQLNSIIEQLKDGDELIISDDRSTDGTIEILKEYQKKYQFVKLFKNEGKGVISNFENALKNCSNEIIFLSDQDDVWLPGKVDEVLKTFKTNDCTLVIHNAYIYNEMNKTYENEDMLRKIGFSTSMVRVTIKNTYIGCCMAFKNEMLKYILPMPSEKEITIHDWRIAICNIKMGKCVYCDKKLINYRIHSSNTLGFNKTSILFKIKKRFNFIKFLLLNRKRFKQ